MTAGKYASKERSRCTLISVPVAPVSFLDANTAVCLPQENLTNKQKTERTSLDNDTHSTSNTCILSALFKPLVRVGAKVSSDKAKSSQHDLLREDTVIIPLW